MPSQKEFSRLFEYLNKLSIKYKHKPLTESQIAMLNKRIAEAGLYYDAMKQIKHTDPLKSAERYLELEKELNNRLRSLTQIILAASDWGESHGPHEQTQLPLSVFVEETRIAKDIEQSKLAIIKVLKKGVNGHS